MAQSNDKRDKKKEPGIKLGDVAYYFDSVERDRMDQGGFSRKSGEVLSLRNDLLKLGPDEFESTIKTLRHLVAEQNSNGQRKADEKAKRQPTPAAQDKLYDSTQTTQRAGASVGKTPAV